MRWKPPQPRHQALTLTVNPSIYICNSLEHSKKVHANLLYGELHASIRSTRRPSYAMTLSQYQLVLVVYLQILRWMPSTAFCVPGKSSIIRRYAKLPAFEHDRDPPKEPRSTSTSPEDEPEPYLRSEDTTLGVSHRVLQRTLVPALAGAVLKATPRDFVVVEIPLPDQEGAKPFSPVDPESPLPEDTRKPIRHKVEYSLLVSSRHHCMTFE